MSYMGAKPVQSAKYECTALVGVNKAGTLKADARGYYDNVVLGAFDYHNSSGAFYPFEDAKHLFESSSPLMRKIATGNLRGEYGHPRKGDMDMRQFINRVCDIYEPNISHHIANVRIDNIREASGRQVIAVLGRVKPAGPMGPALREAFENPEEDVCFSVRSLTEDGWVGNVLHKRMKSLITWDFVNEPGINVARKWNNPSLESFAISPQQLRLARDIQSRASNGMESAACSVMDQIARDLGWAGKSNRPPSADWK